MKSSNAFLSVVGKSITHTNAVKDSINNGARGLVLTQFSEDMMIKIVKLHYSPIFLTLNRYIYSFREVILW